MASADGGLAATLYGPCEVTTKVGDVVVRLREETDYPFRNTIAVTVNPARAHAFPIRLRIPAWVVKATVAVNGKAEREPTPGSFARLERTWRPGDRIEILFESRPRAVPGLDGSTSFEAGPLVFALPIEEKWTKLRQRGLTADWEVKPVGDWAYAVAPDAPLERLERPIGPVPFSRRQPPVVLVTQAQPVAN
jgi:DUF1680 family protein